MQMTTTVICQLSLELYDKNCIETLVAEFKEVYQDLKTKVLNLKFFIHMRNSRFLFQDIWENLEKLDSLPPPVQNEEIAEYVQKNTAMFS